MLRSFRTRLLLSYVFIIGVFLVVASLTLAVLWQTVQNRLTYLRLSDLLRPAVVQVQRMRVEQRPLEQAFQVLQEQAEHLQIRFLLLRRDGTILADTAQTLEGRRLPTSLPPEPAQKPIWGRYRVPEEGVLLYAALPVGPPPPAQQDASANLYLAAASPSQRASLVLAEMVRRLLLAGGVAMLLSLIASIWLSRSVLHPLEQAVQATEAIAQGRYEEPLPEEGPEEVRRLAQGFNRMAREVKASRQAQRDFVANVSHELKTPLTSIQGFAQAIMEGAASDPEAQARAVRIIYEEATRMSRLVQDLLELARMDAGQLELRRAPVDVRALVESLAERMRLRADEASLRLTAQVEGAPRVLADGDRLAQVLGNLVDNAIKHTPVGGEVCLSAQQRQTADGPTVEIAVTDTGSGIPPEDLERIFQRFYQVDKSRSGRRAGWGLGLAIARELVEAMGGHIRAESVQGLGSRFTVTLPALEAGRPAAEDL